MLIILDKYNIQAIASDVRTFARNVNQTFAEPQNMEDNIYVLLGFISVLSVFSKVGLGADMPKS